MITHTIESYWIPSQKMTKSKLQIFEFWNGHYTRHTFWSCLIRCANMKWIRWVLLKIQSYHWVILDPKPKDDKVKVTNFKNSPKFQIFEFWNGHYTRHTFWSCLIRCANMKWIRWVLLKIQSGHDSVHRRTDGQGDTSISPYQLRWSGGYKEDKVKVTNLKNLPKFQILKRALHATHLLKLLDKMCKYEMDPMSIVEDTERTRFCPQTDR